VNEIGFDEIEVADRLLRVPWTVSAPELES
jgi:hypothetical protein